MIKTDSEFRLLHYQYVNEPKTLTLNQLFELIDYLHSENISLLEQLRETSDQNNEDMLDTDSRHYDYKDDMD